MQKMLFLHLLSYNNTYEKQFNSCEILSSSGAEFRKKKSHTTNGMPHSFPMLAFLTLAIITRECVQPEEKMIENRITVPQQSGFLPSGQYSKDARCELSG